MTWVVCRWPPCLLSAKHGPQISERLVEMPRSVPPDEAPREESEGRARLLGTPALLGAFAREARPLAGRGTTARYDLIEWNGHGAVSTM